MSSDELRSRLAVLPGYIQKWLRVDRDQVHEGVLQSVLDAFVAVESPDQREGVTTGLDFLQLLKQEGGDNALWQVGMDQLDSEVYSAVAALDHDDQVALLLPWVKDLDGLATDWDADQWASVLRQQCDREWQPVLRRLVLSRI